MSKAFEELIEKKTQGSLKIYMGYAAGVGKTYAMLQEGHRLKSRGLDIVIGYVEPHARPETEILTDGLDRVPVRHYNLAGRDFVEMDLQAILKRSPKIVLIDELAHTNITGAKNQKRYQDVLDLLESGINVISTINIQHLESVADRVTIATGSPVQERVPDALLAKADQIVMVDVTMEELRERLRAGKIYQKSKADQALTKFFSYENLSFLREIALREVAGDQVRKIQAKGLLNQRAAEIAEEAVMVAMSSDPTHADALLRKAMRMASQLSTRCYAVYVQTQKESATKIDSALQRKLQNNLKLAKTLGADVVTLQSENIAEALITFATNHRVKHAVFGKSRRSPFVDLIKGSVVLNFIYDSVAIDVHIMTTTGEDFDDLTSHP